MKIKIDGDVQQVQLSRRGATLRYVPYPSVAAHP